MSAEFSHQRASHAPSYLALIPIFISFRGLFLIRYARAASGSRSVGGDGRFLRPTGVFFIGLVIASLQVPSKKAELKESLLQIMDDEEGCLDKYLVRKLLLVLEP